MSCCNRNRMYRIQNIQKNPGYNAKFTLTIKDANQGKDVILGIEDADTFDSVKDFLIGNKNDFDDLRNCEECNHTNIHFLRDFGNQDDHLDQDNQYDVFDKSDFRDIKSDTESSQNNVNVNVILLTIVPIQVIYDGRTHDIRCLPDVVSVRDEMIKKYPNLKKYRDIHHMAMPLEIVEGKFIGRRRNEAIAKIGNKNRVLKMSVITDDQLKPMIVRSNIYGVSYQSVQSIADVKKAEIVKNKLQLAERQVIELRDELKDANDRKSGLKVVLDISSFSRNMYTYDFQKFLYAAKNGWYDTVEVTGEISYSHWRQSTEILPLLSSLPIKKIVLSLTQPHQLFEMGFLKFLEDTIIPIILINKCLLTDDMERIATAIENNKNITHFSVLDDCRRDEIYQEYFQRIEKQLVLNRDRRRAIRGVDVGGKDVGGMVGRLALVGL